MAFDNEALEDAFDRLDQRKAQAKQAAEDREWERLNSYPMLRRDVQENGKTARQLASNERIIKKIEAFRDKNLDEYYSRGFDKVYARLTSTD